MRLPWFYCAFGERSAMAVRAAQDAGLKTACHIQGGIDAWKKANGPLAREYSVLFTGLMAFPHAR
jgi:rhodanese-related sulfurtransferase